MTEDRSSLGTSPHPPRSAGQTPGPLTLPSSSAHPDLPGPRILIVDDESAIVRLLKQTLEGAGYACGTATRTQEAKALLERHAVELVVSDINMPEESGLELVKFIQERYRDTAVMLVTAVDDPSIVTWALDHGAYGYIVKPFRSHEILINVANALKRRTLELENRAHTAHLETAVSMRTEELRAAVQKLEAAGRDLRLAQEETVQRLSAAAEYRDSETAQHVQRMSRYCAMLAYRLGWNPEQCTLLRLAATMHDIGKLGVPDGILLKPGPLTPEEFEIMKQHAIIGHHILEGSKSEMVQMASVIALTHHERMDGNGYPKGLRGDQIPVEGRMAAIADVFDALTSRRIYKPALPVKEALSHLEAGRGSHFDGPLLDMFLRSRDEVEAIRLRYCDRG